MKTVPRIRLADTTDAVAFPDLPTEITLALTDIAGAAREGLPAMFEAEITAIAGPKGKHDPDRVAVRHGTEKGSVTLGGRRIAVSRPRARSTDGCEVPLSSYTHFAVDDLLTEVVMEDAGGGGYPPTCPGRRA